LQKNSSEKEQLEAKTFKEFLKFLNTKLVKSNRFYILD
jgi:hypothetical protein